MSATPAQTGPESSAASGRSARLLTLVSTLLLLVGLTWFAVRMSPPVWTGGLLAVLTGFVLLVASVAGALAARLGLPRLTGFVVMGIVAGPSVLGILSRGAVERLHLIDEFALVLIALLAGGELKLATLRPRAATIGATTLAVTGVVALGTTAAVVLMAPLLPFLAGLSLAGRIGVGLLLGVWAANSSPDLTVAVIEETGARGALADVILGTTIVKDVLVIVLFTLTLSLVSPLVGAASGGFDAHILVELAREVGGAVLVGALLGWIFSLYLQAGDGERPPLATFLFGYVLVVVADRFGVELLLAGVTAGFVIENLSPAGDRMIRGVQSVSVVLFAFFFTLAGSSLDLAAVRTVWAGALLLFGVRVFLTWAGTRLGTRLSDASEAVRAKCWRGLVSQGGVTLGLLLLVERGLPEVGEEILNLGMSVVLGGILVGPVLLQSALSTEEGDG